MLSTFYHAVALYQSSRHYFTSLHLITLRILLEALPCCTRYLIDLFIHLGLVC